MLLPSSASITPDEALLRAPANLPVAAPILPSLKESTTAILFFLAKKDFWETIKYKEFAECYKRYVDCVTE